MGLFWGVRRGPKTPLFGPFSGPPKNPDFPGPPKSGPARGRAGGGFWGPAGNPPKGGFWPKWPISDSNLLESMAPPGRPPKPPKMAKNAKKPKFQFVPNGRVIKYPPKCALPPPRGSRRGPPGALLGTLAGGPFLGVSRDPQNGPSWGPLRAAGMGVLGTPKIDPPEIAPQWCSPSADNPPDINPPPVGVTDAASPSAPPMAMHHRHSSTHLRQRLAPSGLSSTLLVAPR